MKKALTDLEQHVKNDVQKLVDVLFPAGVPELADLRDLACVGNGRGN